MRFGALAITLALASLVASLDLMAFAGPFPLSPNLALTPGKLCERPTEYRYPEQIAYCQRDVSFETKDMLIKLYDRNLGYRIESMNRGEFKIDHFIPLCMGGSNHPSNLWPQHKSVYEITDPLEPAICQKMLEGKLSQRDAVALIVKAKTNLNLVPQLLKLIHSI